MLGESGRVQDDEVILVAHAVQVLEGVFGIGRVARVVGEVQGDVLVRQVDGLGRAVYRVHQLGPSAHGVDRESACVAEHVQHAASVGIALQQGAVLALVHEEARLLSLQPVDVELQSILHSHVVGAASLQEAVFGVEVGLEGQGRFRFIIDVVHLAVHHLGQRFGYRHAVQVHAGRVGLHHGRASIHVDDEARQVVALAVHQSVGVVVGPSGHADAAAHVARHGQAPFPEVFVDGLVLSEGEHAHGDASYLVVAFGDEFFFRRVDFHDLTFLGFAVDACDGAREHPGMKALERLFLARFQIYFIHGFKYQI